MAALASEDPVAAGSEGPSPGAALDRQRCQVGGLNQNYSSPSGTSYHIQVEDRGPVLDPVAEREVRRVNVIVYANYGEPRARIIHGRDHDFQDLRTHEHNRFVEEQVQRLAQEARGVITEWEERTVARIKALVREYYDSRSEGPKREFAETNASFPFLFSRAWAELKRDREQRAEAPAATPAPTGPGGEEVGQVLYPLDSELREHVLDIQRLIVELGNDLRRFVEQGGADDVVVQTCHRLVSRARETLAPGPSGDFSAERLEMARTSLLTSWRQIRSRLRP